MSTLHSITLALLAAAILQAPAHAGELQVLKSVNTTLPSAERQFPGNDAEAINNNCLACHSAGMVLNQPAFPRTVWKAEVNKMIHTYKAPISDEDAERIVDYLAAHKGAAD